VSQGTVQFREFRMGCVNSPDATGHRVVCLLP
jgi:hypothetical protein